MGANWYRRRCLRCRKRAEVAEVLVKNLANNHKCHSKVCTGCLRQATRPPEGFLPLMDGRR